MPGSAYPRSVAWYDFRICVNSPEISSEFSEMRYGADECMGSRHDQCKAAKVRAVRKKAVRSIILRDDPWLSGMGIV